MSVPITYDLTSTQQSARRDSGTNTYESLETPALLLDVGVLERNLARMQARLKSRGVPLRPHVKTVKCAEIVRRALVGQPGGITVSTLKEAEYFLAEGVRDILYAVCIAPGKLAHVLDLIKRGAKLTLVLDSLSAAHAVASAGASAGIEIPVLIELDVDGHRSGISPQGEELLRLGAAIAEAPGAVLRGVMTHAGASYNCTTLDDLRNVAEIERAESVRAAHRLREVGLPISVVSVGSTPTALFAESLAGVSEVRAGVFMFMDLVMAGLGVCELDDIAASVLVTVIGHQSDRGWLITDGGWMALTRDRGTASQSVDQGYGVVRAANGGRLDDDLIVHSVSQEHGVIGHRRLAGFDLWRYPVGTLLRILPNHACATAAQHEKYHLVSGRSRELLGLWGRMGGW